jgi:hypothetical protein
MKPAYDQLGDEYKDSSSVLIGDSDCTASGKELCDANDVRGYPTIKYFTSETGPKGTDYSGPRDFDGLKVPTALPHTKTPPPPASPPPHPTRPPRPPQSRCPARRGSRRTSRSSASSTTPRAAPTRRRSSWTSGRCAAPPPHSQPFTPTRVAAIPPRPFLPPPLALPSTPTPNPPFPQAKGKEEVATQLDRLKGMSSGSMKPDLKK